MRVTIHGRAARPGSISRRDRFSRLFTTAFLALILAAALSPLANSGPASAEVECPPGYVHERPVREGQFELAPRCVPMINTDVDFGVGDQSDDQGNPDIPIDADVPIVVEREDDAADPVIDRPPDIDFGPTPTEVAQPEDPDVIDGPILIDGTPMPEDAPDTARIEIDKHVCPAGYDGASKPVQDLFADCTGDGNGFSFNLTIDGINHGDQVTGIAADYRVEWTDMPSGLVVLTEALPAGYLDPVIKCYVEHADGQAGPVDFAQTEAQIQYAVEPGDRFFCDWWNIPSAEIDGVISISKTECPAGYDAYNADIYDLAYNCNTPMADVEFEVSAINQLVASASTDANGFVEFAGLGDLALAVVESVPDGYGEPVVFCTSYMIVDNQPVEDGPHQMIILNGVGFYYELKAGETLNCNWFNVPTEEYGSITIEKYECPAGYDYQAYGADPAVDCPDPMHGITFTLDSLTDPNFQSLQSNTGDSIPGAVHFGGLESGSYVVTELVPAGFEQVFILDCAGFSVPLIQDYPLWVGSDLGIELLAGDHITCRWYNVPAQEDLGSVEVIKYVCNTTTFISADYCERYEGGQEFRLTGVTGVEAGAYRDGITDVTGRLLWSDLAGGTYEIDETGGTWCAAVADNTDAQGYLLVELGQTTHVDVFNCGVKQPTKQPVKYPNTGVGPGAAARPENSFDR